MMTKRFTLLFAILATFAFSGVADAASERVLHVAGGWRITAPEGFNVDVFEVGGNTNDSLFLKLNKFAEFQDLQFIPIVFQRFRGSDGQFVPALPNIVIDSEEVVNNTTFNWIGFQMILLGGNATFDVESALNWDVDPFTTADVSFDDTVVTYGGGVVAAGTTWFPGVQRDLIIRTDLQSFTLKEQPLIPLPPAAWTGLSGLLGLAVIGWGKHVRRLV